MVHVGVGGFHHTHQAMYHDRLMNQGATLDWSIYGVGVLPEDLRMKQTLGAQDSFTPSSSSTATEPGNRG